MVELSRLPIWLIGVLIVGGFVLASVGGLLLYRRVTHGRLNLPEDMNNDVIFFASAISVFYSLTVGLIAVGVWTNYAEVQDIVSGEAASLAALYRDVSGYPEPLRGELQQGLQDYTEFVIDEAWPAQYEGRIVDGGTRLLDQFQARMFTNELLIGAVLSITVTYLLKIQVGVHIVLTAFLAAYFDFNLADVAEVWRRGSVIASWLLDLTATALQQDPQLTEFSGRVSDSGEGRWTILAGIEEGAPTPVLSAALYERFTSRGDANFADKLLSAMRYQFGGHHELPSH